LSLAIAGLSPQFRRTPVVGRAMKTPLLDLVPGLAVAATIFNSSTRMADRDHADDPGQSADSARERTGKTKARQDCKPP
jgi:hypothetical protein